MLTVQAETPTMKGGNPVSDPILQQPIEIADGEFKPLGDCTPDELRAASALLRAAAERKKAEARALSREAKERKRLKAIRLDPA